MAWTTQYYHEFYNILDQLCRIDIKKDAAALNTEVDAPQNPFTLVKPRTEIDQPVWGHGFEFVLEAGSEGQLRGLFTSDMMEYRVELRIAGALKTFGYLDSELYEEDYSLESGYNVHLSGNNGFVLLDRIKFLDGSGNQYTGLKTQWEILQIVLAKWDLLDLVTNIAVAISTTSSELSIGAQETILHNTYVSCSNYYDEDSEPMTCREVLEEILRPYAAFIYMSGTQMKIEDINSQPGTISGVLYLNDFSYSSTFSAPASGVDDITDRGYFETGQRMRYKSGINRQVIKYSKYTPDAVESGIQEEDNFSYSSGTEPNFVQISDIYGSTSYLALNMNGLLNWTFTGGGGFYLTGAKENVNDGPEYFIDKYCQNIGQDPIDETYYDDDHSTFKPPHPYVIGADGYYIKITGKLFPLTRPDPYVEPNGSFTDDANFNYVAVLARVRVGSFMYSPGTLSWITTPGTFTTDHQIRIFGGSLDGNAKNKWNDFQVIPWAFSYTKKHPFADDGVYIYLEPGVYGKIEIDFTLMDYAYVGSVANHTQTAKLRHIYIKDLQIQVVSNPGFQELSGTDIEYIGELDQTWKNEGPLINLKHGCSVPKGTPFDNGALIYKDGSNDYYQLTEWTRGGQTATIEKLLLNTIQSNREAAQTELSIALNNTTGIHSKRLTDDAYMSGKMFLVLESLLDIADMSERLTMAEVKADTHTIS